MKDPSVPESNVRSRSMTSSELLSRARRAARAAAWCLLAALAAGCASEGGWRSLDSLSQLQEIFNQDAGKYRVILLLSPT
jgi:hypothetical protein